jgi:uncharacterized protein
MQTLFHLSPLLITAITALIGLFLQPPRRRTWMLVVMPAFICSLLDLLLLSLLPVLRLSFGPVELPLFFFNFARLVLVLPLLLLLLLSRKQSRPPKAVPVISAGLQVVLSLLAFYALYIEPFRLSVTTLQPEAPQFLPDRPVRILHLTDLHIEHPTRREQEILDQVTRLQPDLIVMTGDYLNPTYMDDPVSIAETRQFLTRLHAPYGVFVVNGTVDGVTLMSTLFDDLEGVQVLDNEVELIAFPGGGLAILGVTNTFEPGADRQALESLAAQVPTGAYTLLLHHTPDLVETASRAGIDLYLAGHTHGGQIRLPFYGALVTFSSFGKQYEMGEYLVSGTMLYVSRGLGMEGWDAPRMRFLCPPEMEIVELGAK